MAPIVTSLLLLFIAMFALTILIEIIILRSFKRAFFELAILVLYVIVLKVTTGFPTASLRQAFGSISPLKAIAIMFVCSILGILANYLFYLKGKFSWKKILKPVVVSPIVFLPLIGSVQSIQSLESLVF